MSIRIINTVVCQNCKKETCAFIDRVTKIDSVFASEGTVCPTGALQANPSQQNPFTKKECIDCGLCVGYCNKSNLEIENEANKFNLEYCNSFGMNALVSNYLNKIFPFAANSNRNSSVLFDGYVEIGEEKEAFVEVDEKDALECLRNLLGDFLLYRGQYANEVNTGLIVLTEIPPRGSSNVYTVIERMRMFPNLESKNIFITTFSMLKYLFLHKKNDIVVFENVFYNPLKETIEEYTERITKETGVCFSNIK